MAYSPCMISAKLKQQEFRVIEIHHFSIHVGGNNNIETFQISSILVVLSLLTNTLLPHTDSNRKNNVV